MHSVLNLLISYAGLEMIVQQLMSRLFSECCALCTARCCRADVCEEAAESAFLSLLLERQGLGMNGFDDRFGWLDANGCTLAYGRPPVCYAYLCDELLDALPDEETRSVARILGRLMFHVGQRARGEQHLTDIADSAELLQVDAGRIAARIDEAREACAVIEAFMESGRLTSSDRTILRRITTDEP